MKASLLLLGGLVFLLAPHAHAQQMKLDIRDGRVSLDAQNVPVRQILAEWARVGGSKVINGDKVVGAPVSLQFDGVPERQALDIILRTVSGYMLAAREPGSVGLSGFDRILILPTSAGPRGNQPPAAAGAGAPPFNQPGMGQPGMGQPGFVGGQPGFGGGQPGMMGRPMPGVQPVIPPVQIDDDVDEPDLPEQVDPLDDDDDQPTPGVFPRPGTRGMPRRPNVFPTPTPQPGVPGMPMQPPPGEGQPSQPVTTAPGNPFGIPAGSSGTPGTITPVPQTPRPPR